MSAGIRVHPPAPRFGRSGVPESSLESSPESARQSPLEAVAAVVPANGSRRALVGFADGCDFLWQRLLRPGFRHCFVLVEDRDRWILVDPLSPHCEVGSLSFAEDDQPAEGPGMDIAPGLQAYLRHRGLTVVLTTLRRVHTRPAPVAPVTCVELVKRVLGIHAPWVLTPWQLYRWIEAADRP